MSDQPETLDRVLDATLAKAGDEPVQFDVAAGKAALAAALQTRTPVAAKPKRVGRWIAAAAAVTVLTGTGLAASTVDLTGTGSGGGPTASAAEQLIKAADLADRVTDQPIAPGQYRYVRSRYEGIMVTLGSGEASYSDFVQEQWIPADRRDEWMLRNKINSVKWLEGHEGQGKPDAATAFKDGQEFRGKCGNYSYYAEGQPDRCTNGTFANPTPEFVAALPKDPALLLAKLKEEGHAGDSGALMQAGEALNSGQYSAEVRATIFRALALLPGLVVTDGKANLDGKQGVALGMKYFDDFEEIIVDPANGDYIGRRETVAEDQPADKGGLKKGTVRSSSAVTTRIVDAQGGK
ncbi:CU044_5270 family protein [Lentzea sp. NPDC058450]|uniref:CU044_5270 family protein n=1 Tax=Lentzea sp. NPDC058450 TaxID=3346505 RepID=UPI00365254EE